MFTCEGIYDGRYNRIYGVQGKPAKLSHVHQVPVLLRQRSHRPHVLAMLQKVIFLSFRHGTSSTPKEETTTKDPMTPLRENKESSEVKTEQRIDNAPQKEENIIEKVNKDRCATCSRKLRLLGIECRCGMFFCNSHRLP